MKPEREDPHTAELDALLGAARRHGALDPAAEERALLAFRAARAEGVRAVRWRRSRDDWRPAGARRRARALKALVTGVVAITGLGGVAVAAGDGPIPFPFVDASEPKPVPSAPAEPGPGQSEERGRGAPEESVRPVPTSGAPSQPPGTTRDTAAHCRVYLDAVSRRGKAPRGEAMAELEAAAGGPQEVRDYCERQLAAEQEETGQSPVDGKPSDVESAEVEPPEAESGEKAAEKGQGADSRSR
ncbi:hypothetical protein [Streptomyces sp. NPDC020681]|uniref:hypothetical protein n=1 Tax=Streptomyces sp. NPDC020681 TaxID=3365083 RepID=UPI0037BDBB49